MLLGRLEDNKNETCQLDVCRYHRQRNNAWYAIVLTEKKLAARYFFSLHIGATGFPDPEGPRTTKSGCSFLFASIRPIRILI